MINAVTYSSTAPAVDAVIVDVVKMTIRPAHPESDDYFGLARGTNGTAATERRRYADAPPGYTWIRANGTPATGLQYVPGQRNPDYLPSPWGGGW